MLPPFLWSISDFVWVLLHCKQHLLCVRLLFYSLLKAMEFCSIVTEFLFLSYIPLHHPYKCRKINHSSVSKAILEITGIK